MRFVEVVGALKEGKKIKLEKWKNAYWYEKDGVLINHDEDGIECPTTEILPYSLMCVSFSNWEIVKEPLKTISFGDAINFLKAGKKAARTKWKEKNTFLVLCPGNKVPANRMKVKAVKECYEQEETKTVVIAPHIDLKSENDIYVTGWFASQEDMLADDWYVVE